jgi:hypothetical protein
MQRIPISKICSILLFKKFDVKPKNPNQAYPFSKLFISSLILSEGKLKIDYNTGNCWQIHPIMLSILKSNLTSL